MRRKSWKSTRAAALVLLAFATMPLVGCEGLEPLIDDVLGEQATGNEG